MSYKDAYLEIKGNFLSISNIFTESIDYLENLFAPDLPPNTIFFGALGTDFYDKFYDLTNEQRIEILALVEKLVQDKELRDSVLTGFVESIVHMEYDDSSKWDRIESMFDAETREYSDSYRKFWASGVN